METCCFFLSSYAIYCKDPVLLFFTLCSQVMIFLFVFNSPVYLSVLDNFPLFRALPSGYHALRSGPPFCASTTLCPVLPSFRPCLPTIREISG